MKQGNSFRLKETDDELGNLEGKEMKGLIQTLATVWEVAECDIQQFGDLLQVCNPFFLLL